MTDNKYDRQLRLWGAAGQAALGNTCVVLVRATAAGTETLKNLVLPGVGNFLVIDDSSGVSDCTSNFFLDSSTHKSRAQMATEYLMELNPDVTGDWKDISGGLVAEKFDLLQLFPDKKKVLVIAADCEPPLRQAIAQTCWDQNVPMIAVHSYGLVGVVQIQTAPLLLLDPKMRDSVPDLRLTCPFPALQQAFEENYADDAVWAGLSSQEFGQVPYPFILLFVQKKWKESHAGGLPTSFAEKQEFQAEIKKMARNYDNELNFQQAVENAYLAYTPPKTVDIDYLLSDCNSERDLVLLRALQSFLQQHGGVPPVVGKIPDMAASTAEYVNLQELYQQQAKKDFDYVRANCTGDTSVTNDEITLLCQNAVHLDWLQTGPLPTFMGYHPTEDVVDDLGASEQDEERPEQTALWWYLGFAACQMFWEREQRYPGVNDDFEKDVPRLLECWEYMKTAYGLSLEDTRICKEMARFGNAEVHNIASVVGGVASQEAVKLITGQYIPIKNTYVFNGIASMGGVYHF
ncbi:amyloid beta precursor protein binding protein 1 [Fistulifera solaris]|uniref:NEDD8-activating enzyme E1 regulatory subunit n=1 Tax=Fistulifera solaris TaxID=1519565 RepID=A0A1Z5JH49_FISSO|nr:amyloid beta precursor protein binding protein 1 [Fistulifera solaris]|eukprot:GAX13098.1 amyloid beta precursor protein binding protein 1 [Fistulifera solaris]